MNRLVITAAAAITAVSLYSAVPAKAEQAFFDAPAAAQDFSYEDHELNDAWLGLPFYGINGDIIGFVVDAPVNEFDEVTELHIGQPVLDWPHAAEVEDQEPMIFNLDQVAVEEDRILLLPGKSELVATLVR